MPQTRQGSITPVDRREKTDGVVHAPRRRLQSQQIVAADDAQQQAVLVCAGTTGGSHSLQDRRQKSKGGSRPVAVAKLLSGMCSVSVSDVATCQDVPVTGRPLTFRATMRSMALYTESCGRTAITSVVMMSATSRSSKQPCMPMHVHHRMPSSHLPLHEPRERNCLTIQRPA